MLKNSLGFLKWKFIYFFCMNFSPSSFSCHICFQEWCDPSSYSILALAHYCYDKLYVFFYQIFGHYNLLMQFMFAQGFPNVWYCYILQEIVVLRFMYRTKNTINKQIMSSFLWTWEHSSSMSCYKGQEYFNPYSVIISPFHHYIGIET